MCRPFHLISCSTSFSLLLYSYDVKHIVPRNRRGILKSSLNVSASWSKDWELDLSPIKSEHLPTGNSHILSFTSSCPMNHPTPRKSHKFPLPISWELFQTPSSALPIKPDAALSETILRDPYSKHFLTLYNYLTIS